MEQMKTENRECGNKKINKISVIYLLIFLIWLVLFIFTTYAFCINDKLKKSLIEKDAEYASLLIEHEKLLNKYKEEAIPHKYSGDTCVVSYSSKVKRSIIVVKAENRFNLKNGDKVKLTYHNRQITTTIDFFVHIDPKTHETDYSDFIISKRDMQILTNQKKLSKGIYSMVLMKCE